MCFRNDGILYMSYVDYRQNPDSGVIYISQSHDGGITWLPPAEAWNLSEDTIKKPIDRPWLICDRSASINNGMLYITTKPAPWVPAPNRPYLKTSADSGATWSAYRFIDSTGFLVGNFIQAPMGAVATSADGALCVGYPSYLVSQSVFPNIYFAKSYNRGATFQYYELVNNPVFPMDTNLKSGYCLVANPSDANELAYAYIGGQNGDADIFICSSNDGGITWDNPVRVNDDAIGNGKLQDLVWASYNLSGDLAVTWRDRRNSNDSGFYQPCETFCAISHDNGASFDLNFLLSTVPAPFDSVLALDGNDFMSCNLAGDSICATWGDVRNGKLNIYFSKTSDSTGTSTGIIQVATEDEAVLDIYPNPASEKVTIVTSPTKANALLEITDGLGRKIFEKKNPSRSETINCSMFLQGNYQVTLKEGSLLVQKKFIISK
jgi:hypothetical protein